MFSLHEISIIEIRLFIFQPKYGYYTKSGGCGGGGPAVYCNASKGDRVRYSTIEVLIRIVTNSDKLKCFSAFKIRVPSVCIV